MDEQGNEVENLVFGAAGYSVSDYTENNSVTYGLPYQADIMTLCSATGGAVNQIQYWIEAEATGETTERDLSWNGPPRTGQATSS